MEKTSFIVDAAILQELGERLVGRPAIALGELVKNAYDADATICRIEFGLDEIVVSDNGSGMTDADFLKFWMRLATTHKVHERTSPSFKRSLTGSKGIGRLAAQFLAHRLTLDSVPARARGKGIHAEVDWRSIIAGSDLKEFTVKWKPLREATTFPGNSTTGTQINLSGLKSDWDAADLEDLGSDIWLLRSPFKGPTKSRRSAKGDEFTVEIEAPHIDDAKKAFDRTLDAVFSNWKARIRGHLENGRAGGKAVVSVEFRKGYPTADDEARRFQTTTSMPVSAAHGAEPLIDSLFFEILVFKTVGRQPAGIAVSDLREYLGRFGNISVYDAGFRLPYYGSKRDEIGEDWLSIAADQGRRLNLSELLPEELQTPNKYMQDLPAPGRIFGAVDIDTNHERRVAEGTAGDKRVFLQIQSGRDRLHDNDAFYQLRDLVRFSIDYYANRYRALNLAASERERPPEAPSTKLERALDLLDRNKSQLSPAVYRVLSRELSEAARGRKVEEAVADQRAALLAPLASAGMTALALNHEISRESNFLGRIVRRLRQLATKHAINELLELASEFEAVKKRLDSVRQLFAPLLSEEDRAPTDRLRVEAVVKQVLQAMSSLMPGVTFRIEGMPSDLRFPLGSLAEWTSILQNILSNAWNAMLESSNREIMIEGGKSDTAEWVRVSDTGAGLGIPLADSEHLFEPFERRIEIGPDKRSIAIGGQGLGLSIVRMLARRRRANVRFVEPLPGYSTTFELVWRRPRS